MEADLYKILKGDCMELMETIEAGSVDMILTDPPYGTIKGTAYKGWTSLTTEWDIPLDTRQMWRHVGRVLRMNGACALFGQEPFTSKTITEATSSVPFSYRLVWLKDSFGIALGCRKFPMKLAEDISMFFKRHDDLALHPLRQYFKIVLDYIELNLNDINKALGHRKLEHSLYVTPRAAVICEIGGKGDHATRFGSTQFALCTASTYQELVDTFGIDKMEGFLDFSALSETNRKFKRTFNLWQGGKYKPNVLEYKKDTPSVHPTQKPVALLEDLIKTYTSAGDLVLDFTMGSGSTGVACANAGRRFIGIEQDEKYFEIARGRISKAYIKAAKNDIIS